MQHPDHIRRKQPRLHVAAEQHRFTIKQIAAIQNEGSRLAQETLYALKIEALNRALRELMQFQGDIMAMHLASEDAKQDRAIAELLRA